MEPGKQRIYNKAFEGRTDVVQWDVQDIKDQQQIKVTFISTNSNKRQGIWLATDSGIEVMGTTYPSVQLWEDTAPKEVVCVCHSVDGLLSVYNIWDKGKGADSQSYSSGMLIEDLGSKLIYRCNDIGFETNFDKIVFSLENVDNFVIEQMGR